MTQPQDPFNHNSTPKRRTADNGNIARAMMFLGWILFFGLLTMFFSHYLSPRVEGRITSTGDRIVTLYRNNHNQYLSTGKINGQNVVYLIDTGATGISIPPSVANKAGLRKGSPSRVSTANGIRIVYGTRIKTLELGPIVIQNLRAHINPGLTDNQILLGMRVLRKLDIRIKGDTMTLRQRKSR